MSLVDDLEPRCVPLAGCHRGRGARYGHDVPGGVGRQVQGGFMAGYHGGWVPGLALFQTLYPAWSCTGHFTQPVSVPDTVPSRPLY